MMGGMLLCAVMRSAVSLVERAGMGGVIPGSDGLLVVRKDNGKIACQKTGGRAQVPRAVRRGIRVIWQRPDCLNPSLQKVKCHTRRKGTCNRRRSLRQGGVSPAAILRDAGAMPYRAFKEADGMPKSR